MYSCHFSVVIIITLPCTFYLFVSTLLLQATFTHSREKLETWPHSSQFHFNMQTSHSIRCNNLNRCRKCRVRWYKKHQMTLHFLSASLIFINSINHRIPMINEQRRGRGPRINPVDSKLPALLYSGKVGARVRKKGHEPHISQ